MTDSVAGESRAGDDVLYLYGFVPGDAPDPPTELAGLEGTPVETLPFDSFRAVISRLPAGSYHAAALDTRLGDLTWVPERGLAHERVVSWFVDHTHILPAPLFTLYSGIEALRDATGARVEELRTRLQALDGLREWDLKVGYDADVLAKHAGELSEQVRAFDAELASSPPGRRYLLEKKRNAVVAGVLGDLARCEAEALLEALAEQARELRALPLPRTEADLPVVLYAALLLEHSGEPEAIRRVRDRSEALGRIGISIDWSGPWAPYRFIGANDG